MTPIWMAYTARKLGADGPLWQLVQALAAGGAKLEWYRL